jgi:hypothetical protein
MTPIGERSYVGGDELTFFVEGPEITAYAEPSCHGGDEVFITAAGADHRSGYLSCDDALALACCIIRAVQQQRQKDA